MTVYMSKIIYLFPAEYDNNVFNSKSYYTNSYLICMNYKYDNHTILYSTNLSQLVVSRLFDLLAYHWVTMYSTLYNNFTFYNTKNKFTKAIGK